MKGTSMNVYIVRRLIFSWCEDYAMVVVAEDKLHAERKARWSSEDFRQAKDLKVTEVKLNKEQCVLVANTGG